MDIFEMEERILQRQLEDGEIDTSEYNKQMREIEGEYAAMRVKLQMRRMMKKCRGGANLEGG